VPSLLDTSAAFVAATARRMRAFDVYVANCSLVVPAALEAYDMCESGIQFRYSSRNTVSDILILRLLRDAEY
jgi:hypothetical protein